MVTIHDIARKADVSTATVSRVLNGKSSSEKTRGKVLKIVKELNYFPSAFASGLRAGRHKKLGIVIPDISNPFYPSSIKTFYDTAKHRGYNIILGNTCGSVVEELEVLSLMSRERVSGLMLETCEGEEDRECYPVLKDMIAQGLYLVLLGKQRNGLNADMISVDNLSGAYKAVNYLLRIGRRKIAFICGAKSGLSGEQRYAGYLKALFEAGIEEEQDMVSFGEWTIESGRFQADDLIARRSVDGIFCANDLLAIGVIDAIKKKGMSIPGDIAVVGFDNIHFSCLLSPKLTTIHQPIDRIAADACNLLIDRIEGKYKGAFREVFFEPELVLRESA